MGKPNRPTPPPLPWEVTSHYPGLSPGEGCRADPTEGDPGLRELNLIPVSSSNVDSIGWQEAADYKLFVRFKNGSLYAYDASEQQYDAMFAASSPGRYVYHVLRHLPYRRVY